jgi:hypothetical protein
MLRGGKEIQEDLRVDASIGVQVSEPRMGVK